MGTCAIQGDEVDCLKAAISDGLKKCLTLFGVGLHLYEEGAGNGSKASRRTPSAPAPRGAAKAPARKASPARRKKADATPEPAPAPAPGPTPESLTEAQERAVFAISRQAGFTAEQLGDIVFETYGVETVEGLSKTDASAFIGWLQEQTG